MGTYVLVHGSYHGGWCWRFVARQLRGAGHEVFTPTLTGLGERAHLLGPDVGLDTHATDVVQVIDFEDLADVILVGHSYGALVCAAAASRRPTRIGTLVHFDGPVPLAGESALDLNPMADRIRGRATDIGGVAVLPVPTTERMGIEDDELFAWVLSKETPQPFKAVTDPLRLDGPYAPAMRRVYLWCERNAAGRSRSALRRADESQGWLHIRLDAGHDAMVAAPDAVSAALLSLVDGSPG